jgi:hypothetical protein
MSKQLHIKIEISRLEPQFISALNISVIARWWHVTNTFTAVVVIAVVVAALSVVLKPTYMSGPLKV